MSAVRRRSCATASITTSILAVIGLAVLASPAAAAFDPAVDLQTGTASNPQVATDADGDSAVVWEFAGGRVQARTFSSAGVPGPILELGSVSGTSDNSPQVAIDASGDAVFVWARTSPVEAILARRLSASGTLGPLQTLASGTVSAPQIATDVNGDTVFTWVNLLFTPDRVQARTMNARGVPGQIRGVSPGTHAGSSPQVATDAGGDSVLTWTREDGIDGNTDIVQGRTLTVNGSLGPILDLSDPAGRAFGPQVASDDDGDTIFTWVRFDGARDAAQARPMTAAGVLGVTFNLTSGPSAIAPQVDMDSAGDSVFTWERFLNPDDRVQARTRTAAGTLGAVATLSTAGQEAFAQQVASDATGDSAVTYLRSDGANDLVQVRPMTAGGAFGAPATLSLTGVDAETPQVAMGDVSGDAIVVWERGGTVQASQGP